MCPKNALLLICLVAADVTPCLAETAHVASVPAGETTDARLRRLKGQWEAARNQLKERTDAIEAEKRKISAALKEQEPQGGGTLTPDELRERDKLIARRSVLEDELTFLQAMVSARRSAVEAQQTEAQYLQELELFTKRSGVRPVYYGPAEIAYIRAQVEQARSIVATIEQSETGRRKRLEVVEGLVQRKDSGQNVNVLQAERVALVAQIESTLESRESWQAQIRFLETKLSVASPATASAATRPVTTGPANDRKDADNKQKLADLLEREAFGERETALRALEEIRQKMAAAVEKSQFSDTSRLEDDKEYWERKLSYESRRVRQADAEKRIALEKRQIAQLTSQLEDLRGVAQSLTKIASRYGPEERKDLSEEYRRKAESARQQSQEAERRVQVERPASDLWEKLLQSIDTLELALRERVQREYDYDPIYNHYRRMVNLLDAERQQISSMQNSWEVITFALQRQATLWRQVGDLDSQCADVLLPPQPSFRERHRRIINSLLIMLFTIGAGYALKLVIRLAQRLIRVAALRFPGRFSAKRGETLLSFFGSIIHIFIWVFAVMLMLNEFGFDQTRIAGVIGLISLLLAGMFQQVLVDFVKGFDIITGRHYNVGDFVELDGKTGHVIDFSVKHTRIRTASGQEYNLPNSKCIPSRRFPDGYVDNYVDVAIKSTGDLQRAKRAIAPICRHLSRRIEHVKDEPIFVDQFPGTRSSSVILRYRVRVLPGSDWVVKDLFIPDVKAALNEEGIELIEEPTYLFINRIQVFRQLFSRELTEEEILKEAKDQQRPTVERSESPADGDLPPPKQASSEGLVNV